MPTRGDNMEETQDDIENQREDCEIMQSIESWREESDDEAELELQETIREEGL
jgi:hypothetical protein